MNAATIASLCRLSRMQWEAVGRENTAQPAPADTLAAVRTAKCDAKQLVQAIEHLVADLEQRESAVAATLARGFSEVGQ